jgi:O-antigen ligase/lipopolysaccharide biosynthesis regulator YciM
MSQKTYLYILKFGVYLSLISVFLVFKSFLFPFITSKQIFFNILIEVLFIVWIAFMVKYPEYRPKRSYITYGLAAFFAAMVLSSFFGVDFNLSFWGDIERMLGVFHILHFFAFYLILITVMRSWSDWRTFFIISVIFSVFVSIYGLAGDTKAYSTIGNTAYVSAYIIFNLYFVALLFFRDKQEPWSWIYLAAVPFLLFEFDNANTTGAYVGLAASVLLVLFLYGILSRNKRIKIATISLLVVGVGLVAFAITNRSAVSGVPVLHSISSINFNKPTFQTRLISWQAAAEDFVNHPVLGTGHGNYAITFDKYFDPEFYNYTRSETYFDRAHNNLIDIASTTGIVGLLAYLLIFAAVFYYLIRGFIAYWRAVAAKENYGRIKGLFYRLFHREDAPHIGLHEFILLTGLIAAYFVQNLAVFDSLVTYISLMMVLAYIYWLSVPEMEERPKDRKLENGEIYAFAIAGVIILTILYQYNVKPIKMLQATIAGQQAYAQGNVEQTFAEYRRALSYDTVLDRDSRTSLIRLFISNPSQLQKLSPDERGEALEYLVDLAKQNVEYNPGDSLHQMMLAQMLNVAARYSSSDPETFEFYSQQALEHIDKSIEASPERIPIYFQKAQIYLTRNENDKAIETLEEAAALNPEYYDSFCHLGRTLLFLDRTDEAFEYMDKCIDLGGTELLAPADMVKDLVNHYVESEDWDRVLSLYGRLTELEREEPQHWVNMAKLYAKMGERDKAIEAARQAGQVDGSLADYVEGFIQSLDQPTSSEPVE